MDTPRSPFAGLRPAGLVLALWPAVLGGVLWHSGTDRGVVAARVCAAPALATLVLAATSQADRRQYVARLLAAAAMLPLLLLMWALEPPRAASVALLVGLLALHGVAFLAAVLWLAVVATRIDAAPGVAPVPPGLLVARLRSLGALGLPLRVAPGGGPDQWQVDLEPDAASGRVHRVLLSIDAHTAQVRVRERLGTSDASPRGADEASMRAIGDPAFDPARPSAARVHARVAQATMVEPHRLETVSLRWSADGVATADAGARDVESLVTLLAALVMRSGYRWQPLLFAHHG